MRFLDAKTNLIKEQNDDEIEYFWKSESKEMSVNDEISNVKNINQLEDNSGVNMEEEEID